MVIRDRDNKFHNYQLKNSATVKWGEGDKSIRGDFERQKRFYDCISKDSALYLVVSDLKLQNNLSQQCPKSIECFTKVLYFPYQTIIGRSVGVIG
jgi:hypothetical protein